VRTSFLVAIAIATVSVALFLHYESRESGHRGARRAPTGAALDEPQPASLRALPTPAPIGDEAPRLRAGAGRAETALADAAPLVSATAASQPLPSASAAVAVPGAAALTAPAASAPGSAVIEARRVPAAALAAWLKPGMCSISTEASGARERVMTSFQLTDSGEGGKLYLDPRLPPEAAPLVLGYLQQAEATIARRMNLSVTRPVTFVYADKQLMKAAACINDEAVAFYDGSLHVVAGRSDVLESVLHEYTHHVLFGSGLWGPVWAQEGIAMNVAGERWWRDQRLLRTLLDRPFSLDDMEHAIPYKLTPQQAVSFYVQSALTVDCLLRTRSWNLRQMYDVLRAGSHADSISYELPELAQASFLSGCVASLAR